MHPLKPITWLLISTFDKKYFLVSVVASNSSNKEMLNKIMLLLGANCIIYSLKYLKSKAMNKKGK